jgi:pimeloyl-ACP methyl ester carboxylesterase
MTASLPLVLVPGALCDEALFGVPFRSLSSSVVVAKITGEDTIEAMAESVLAEAPPEFAIAGLSLGGIVAAEIVDRAPHRVRGLGLLDTNLGEVSEDQVATRTRWASQVRAGQFASMVAEELVTPLTSDADRHGGAIFDMAMRVGAAAFLRQNHALLHRHDRRQLLDSVSVPVLVACGGLDTVTPPFLHGELVQRCALGTYRVVPDAGHLSTIDQPEALAHVLTGWIQTCNTNKHLQEGQENEYNLA